MKTREVFDLMRKQKTPFGLRFRMVVLVTAEIICSIIIAIITNLIIYDVFLEPRVMPMVLEVAAISLAVGVLVTSALSKLFFKPIEDLGKAMEAVADGDFTVRLPLKSSDTKEIKEIYSGFNLMVHELAATEILQTDFVSNVSHEFKTPINAIEGYSTLLQSGELSNDQQHYVEKILYNTERLSSLVGSILLLSKIENQSIPTNQTVFRLDEQIRQSIVALEPAWEKKDIEFDVEMQSVEYTGNEMLMRHVWDNLIGNAIKFDPPCGLVRIRLHECDSYIRFTIDDSGSGISEDALKHIFDKFYQADSSHKEEGNGLGLALVKKILTSCNGTISAENLPQCGCRFRVTLYKSRSK